jgi:hypothetical protein
LLFWVVLRNESADNAHVFNPKRPVWLLGLSLTLLPMAPNLGPDLVRGGPARMASGSNRTLDLKDFEDILLNERGKDL